MTRSSCVLLATPDGELIMFQNRGTEPGMETSLVRPFSWELMHGERPQNAVVRGLMEQAHFATASFKLNFVGTKYRRKADVEEHLFTLENVATGDLKLVNGISLITIRDPDVLGDINFSSFGREVANEYFLHQRHS